jgi:hypothetical protein
MSSPSNVLDVLRQLITAPSLAQARQLESALRSAEFSSHLFGRLNQKSSIDAAAESDRGIVERIANSFDASLTAARILAGLHHSEATLTPRRAAQRFLNANTDSCEWKPEIPNISFDKPTVQFWPDDSVKQLRFRKYHAPEGLVTVLIQDTSLGIARDKMSTTILDLNSDDKLKTFEAIGQFGHGGSSALAFCELSLIMTAPRFESRESEFYWTLIFAELEGEASKQSIARKWFCSGDGLPLADSLDAVPQIAHCFPGTSIWHYGYTRGPWLKTAVGTHQDTPAGRLGRLFFSYPLPFEIRGELARGDTPTGVRTIKGAYYRLLEDRGEGDEGVVEYRTGEKSETLRVEGVDYGSFSVYAFVLRDRGRVRNYVDNQHPVIITLNGQNHGEMTSNLLVEANFPEISGSAIVEVRLDGLDEEALSNIVSNSRENPKNSPFTRALRERVRELLAEDEGLLEIERRRQEAKAQQSSEDLNQKISRFLAAILSDAVAGPTEGAGGGGPGKQGGRGNPRPEIPPCDPPQIFEFISPAGVFVPEGTAKMLKFKSDARPPRYSFHGDNPRCFARLTGAGPRLSQLSVTGKADIDGRGYGSVTLSCVESTKAPVSGNESAGEIEIVLQTTDGRTLSAKLAVGVAPKPPERDRHRKQSVRPEIRFCAANDADKESLKELLLEKNISPLSASLENYRDLLNIPDNECAYWGAKTERSGESWLIVDINVGHPRFVELLKACTTAEERVRMKQRIVEDIVLDCYQHAFRLDDVPDSVHEQVVTEPHDLVRASEICLNLDKSIRMASMERKMAAK